MWTRIKHSLTLRIFLMTCGLMIAVCAATYGAIAYLTPLTYTSILQEDLDQKTEALLTALSGREPSACDELLSAFCRETGAALRLSDEYGRILYDTISSEAYLVEGTAERAAITTEESETLEQDAVMQATEAGDATGTAESVIHQITVTDAYISADEARPFFFRDRTMGYLLVVGGKKAVNQASEAMKKTLPFLVLLILGVSLLTSFFYTRWITRPIVDISHIAARIAGLDFSSRWAQHRTDEIGALGDSLNTLSDNLSDALTELKTANERLQQDMEHERDMERQRSAFFSAASHELKTPLTVILSNAELLEAAPLEDRPARWADNIRSEAGQMKSLVEEMLTLARADNAVPTAVMGEVSLSDLATDCVLAFEPVAFEAGKPLESDITPDVTVTGDADKLRQLIGVLLDNAIKYGQAGGTISLTLRRTDRQARLLVSNPGDPIPPDQLGRLFERFYRADASRGEQSGFGLGLPIAASIATEHKGTLKAESDQASTRFLFSMPLKK